MERPTWRPDIRAAVISKARVNMHRKPLSMARPTGRYQGDALPGRRSPGTGTLGRRPQRHRPRLLRPTGR
ncbi:hypothetical protein BV882_26905 [Streptomyces sp. 46]|nr:hypothetical protein BV882_26905 [Streptomyces sp. 46]